MKKNQKQKKQKNKVVLALSGGMDSTLLLYLAASSGEFSEIHTITFDYGQRHKREIECAKIQIENVAKQYNIKVTNRVLDIHYLKDITPTSSLTNLDVANPKISEMAGDAQPSSYVPFRNMQFLAICAALAESVGAETIYYGATKVDSLSGYFDCDENFINAMNSVISLNRKHKIVIKAPMITMDKADIVTKSVELEIDLSNTYTCYSGEDVADATTPASALRLKGFIDAGYKDPQQYIQQDRINTLYTEKGCRDTPK